MSVLKEVFLLTIGWISLGVLGTLLTLFSLPQFALNAVASIGIIASLRGIRRLRMLLAMILASILGGYDTVHYLGVDCSFCSWRLHALGRNGGRAWEKTIVEWQNQAMQTKPSISRFDLC